MKKIFQGKKRFVVIPIVLIISFAFLPFVIAAILAWFVHKKVSNKKFRYAAFAVIILFTLFFGSAWVFAMTSSNTPKQQVENKKEQTDRNSPQATKPVEPSTPPSGFKAQPAPNNSNIVLAQVIRVVDGDTIEVDLGGGNKKKIRYIGIDTPETVDPRKGVQCFGKEASAKNQELVGNNIVGLEKDVSETDKYGRLLRYVYKGDLLVNEILVAEGYAHSSSYPPDIKYQDKFRLAEQKARTSNLGLWNLCSATPVPNSNPAIQQVPATNILLQQNSGTYTCNCSKTCTQISSCSEAQYLLNTCGCKARDNDRDGIACDGAPLHCQQ